MKQIRILMVGLVVALFLGVNPSSAAGVAPEEWPACGDTMVFPAGPLVSPNLKVSYVSESGTNSVEFRSYNGWKITLTVIGFTNYLYQPTPTPSGVTFSSTTLPGDHSEILNMRVDLTKDCSGASTCRLTDLYVYTLLGSYPCNLLSAEHPIPERFLNRDYTAPLCSLPGQDFSWNGKYLVNKVKDCGGYLVGGQYFDTRLGPLP